MGPRRDPATPRVSALRRETPRLPRAWISPVPLVTPPGQNHQRSSDGGWLAPAATALAIDLDRELTDDEVAVALTPSTASHPRDMLGKGRT